jgi:hypothetical protein
MNTDHKDIGSSTIAPEGVREIQDFIGALIKHLPPIDPGFMKLLTRWTGTLSARLEETFKYRLIRVNQPGIGSSEQPVVKKLCEEGLVCFTEERQLPDIAFVQGFSPESITKATALASAGVAVILRCISEDAVQFEGAKNIFVHSQAFGSDWDFEIFVRSVLFQIRERFDLSIKPAFLA